MIQRVEKKVHFPLSPQTRVQINELRDLHPLLHPNFTFYLTSEFPNEVF